MTAQTNTPAASADERTFRKRVYVRKTDVVLEAAESAFLRNGFGGTSMEAIAELAGVSKRTVYSNFRNKQELFAAVIQKRCADVLPRGSSELLIDRRDPETVLTELAIAFLTGIFSRRQIELYQTVVAESRVLPEIGRIMFEGPVSGSQRLFAEYLRRQVDCGNLELPDVDMGAAQLIALLKTNVHMKLLFNQPVELSKADMTTMCRSSVRLFLHGASAQRRPAASGSI